MGSRGYLKGVLDLEPGPYTKFEGKGLELVAGQTLSGDFGFEKEANGDVRGLVKWCFKD